ncbi:MAG: M48 family metallopeptidase [Flavobacterium micromati]|nr:M48 family metallopeptidase [Flavobacterium micromati]
MNIQSVGVYFDGRSSVPQDIVIHFDKLKGRFIFEGATAPYKEWNIKEVTFEFLENGLQIERQGENAIEILKIIDQIFIEEIKKYRKENKLQNWYEQLINKGLKMHLVFAAVIIVLIGLTYVYVIPWVGERSVAIIPESYDATLGNTFLNENMLFADKDVSKTKTLNAFAKELQLNNTKPLQFIFVNDNMTNAFALPDGTIIVYAGIVDRMENYDELVALLGHESAHVNNRHSMKMLCRNLSGYLFISAILGDANGIMAVLGENVNSLQSLSFSRKFEQEADRDGFKILIKNKVNPKGMSNLFKRLQEDQNSVIPEFLSSHPVTEERINNSNKWRGNKKFAEKENKKLTTLFNDLKK